MKSRRSGLVFASAAGGRQEAVELGEVFGGRRSRQVLGDGEALDDLIHGLALFGLKAFGVVQVFFAVVFYVALDAVQEVDAKVPDGGQVAVFPDARDDVVQEFS